MFVLAGVTVRAINNQTMRGCGFGGHFGAYVFHGFGHGFGIVVRAVNRAAQHHMAVRVAKGLDCAGTPQMVNAEERVLLSSGEATVDRCLHRAVSGILKADRHGKPAGQLAVDLALVGEQVELARIAMTRLADKGYSLSSPEMLEANETFSKLSNQFLALQEQYETYRDELLRNQKTNPALSQKID